MQAHSMQFRAVALGSMAYINVRSVRTICLLRLFVQCHGYLDWYVLHCTLYVVICHCKVVFFCLTAALKFMQLILKWLCCPTDGVTSSSSTSSRWDSQVLVPKDHRWRHISGHLNVFMPVSFTAIETQYYIECSQQCIKYQLLQELIQEKNLTNVIFFAASFARCFLHCV